MLLLLLHSQGAQPCSTTLMFLCLNAFPGNSKGPCSFWAANIVRIWGNFSSLLRPAGCLPLHTAFFSARRCLVSGKLKTLMAGYMRFLNDFPSSSQLCEFLRISSLGPEQGSFMLTSTVLCHSSAVLPTVCLQIKGTNAHSTEWLTLVPLIPTFSIILHLGVIPKHRS